MKFAVLGAGAIGGYAGAALARGGADVTLIARGPHLAALAAHGVRVLSPRGDFTAHPPATGDLAAVADADVVLVALKANSLPGIAPRLGTLLKPGAAAIWAQNGIPWWYFQSLPDPPAGGGLQSVDPGGVIAASIAPEHNVGCVVYCSTEIVEPGVIRHIEGTRFTLGEPDGTLSARCREISAAFAAGGLRAPVEARLRDQIWLKLVGNVAFNPITALTRATLGELGTLPEMHDLLRQIFAECAAVAGARDQFPGLAGPAAGGRARRRRPQDVHAAGPRGRQAPGTRLHDRRGRRAGRAARRQRPAPAHRARLREAPGRAGRHASAQAGHRTGSASLAARTGRRRPPAGVPAPSRAGRPPVRARARAGAVRTGLAADP